MTEVVGPLILEKIKVVYSFPSPGVNGAMQDADAFILSQRRDRGLSTGHDDDYYVEAYDDEVRVWFEYEKPTEQSPPLVITKVAGAYHIAVPVVGHKAEGETDADRYEEVAQRLMDRVDIGGSNTQQAVVTLLRNVAIALRNQ